MRSSITSSYGFKLDPVFQEEIDKNIKIYNDIHEDFHFGVSLLADLYKYTNLGLSVPWRSAESL